MIVSELTQKLKNIKKERAKVDTSKEIEAKETKIENRQPDENQEVEIESLGQTLKSK